jgi:hypothetical protein
LSKRWRTASLLFEGEVTGTRFELQRIIEYRNSLLPRSAAAAVMTLAGFWFEARKAEHLLRSIFSVP